MGLWVCYHNNSKLRASILTKLGLLVKVVTISSWLNFGCTVPPGRGSAAGWKFLAPPYYSQRAVFASLSALFFIETCISDPKCHCYVDHRLQPKRRSHNCCRILPMNVLSQWRSWLLQPVRSALTHQSYAFLNIHSQGDTVTFDFQDGGTHGHCHICTQRSGCGIMARCRPSAEHRPAMPAALPLGLSGYSVVGDPPSSTYCIATSCRFCNDSNTDPLLKTTRPATKAVTIYAR